VFVPVWSEHMLCGCSALNEACFKLFSSALMGSSSSSESASNEKVGLVLWALTGARRASVHLGQPQRWSASCRAISKLSGLQLVLQLLSV
jgi:hypothetical protein